MTGKIDTKVSAAPFEADAQAATFRRENPKAGAIVIFMGQVRDENGTVTALKLEHYPGFTEQSINAMAQTAADRWKLDAVRICHRVGALSPGETIVFVATAAAHRRAAFEAADCLMDYLKSEAPFWKQEVAGSRTRWIEPREQDIRDKTRWRQPGCARSNRKANHERRK